MLIEFDFDIEADFFYQQGVHQEKVDAIIEMLKDGVLTIEQIAKYQRISIDEVLEIKEEWEGEQIDLP
jgi:DNA-directed RNA polymerase specialized sigma subunit